MYIMKYSARVHMAKDARACNGGRLRNVLTLVSFEDLLQQYSWFKNHAFGLEL